MHDLPELSAGRNIRRDGVRRGGPCPCCGRDVPLTFHHLIPRKMHRRPRFRKHYDRDTLQLGLFVCRACHSGIHRTYDEMTLATHYSTPQALLQDPTLQRHFRWVGRQRRS